MHAHTRVCIYVYVMHGCMIGGSRNSIPHPHEKFQPSYVYSLRRGLYSSVQRSFHLSSFYLGKNALSFQLLFQQPSFHLSGFCLELTVRPQFQQPSFHLLSFYLEYTVLSSSEISDGVDYFEDTYINPYPSN